MKGTKKVIKIWSAGVSILAAALFLLLLNSLPQETMVSRAIEINASPRSVFQVLGDAKSIVQWGPWFESNADFESESSGRPKVGSQISWRSDAGLRGSGKATITTFIPFQTLSAEIISHTDGVRKTMNTRFLLSDLGDNTTQLVWQFSQRHGTFMDRLAGLFWDRKMAQPLVEGLDKIKSIVEQAHSISTQEIFYEANGVRLTGYLAVPKHRKHLSGVMLVHEWWGHNDYVRGRAEMLAELGYAAFAVDMYGDGKVTEHPDQAKAFMMEALGEPEEITARFQQALTVFTQTGYLDDTGVAALGYCFGGSVVLNMARSGVPLKAAVSFHGGLAGLSPIADGTTTPLLVLNGAADPMVTKDQKIALKESAKASQMPLRFIDYPGAKHAFTNPQADKLGEQFQLPLAYDAQADKLSWQEMLKFLDQEFE